MNSSLRFSISDIPSAHDVIEVFRESGISRPISDPDRISKMIENASLIVTAWDSNHLVGIARSLTDFSWCCYLSDLATHKKYQGQGVGRKLIELTRQAIGVKCNLVLISAPSAMTFYPKVGFAVADNAFLIKRQP